jgi:hypothetical protein
VKDGGLFAGDLVSGPIDPAIVAPALNAQHYLGASKRGLAWSDEFGVLILANPTSRRLPHDRWLELVRWCLSGEKNAGSRQWARVRRWLQAEHPEITTVVSYSDPSANHTGALYRACGWLWAPTHLRLAPCPSGNGSWKSGEVATAKDRWIDPLWPDPARADILANREKVPERFWDVIYREPQFRRGRLIRGTGGGDWQTWISNASAPGTKAGR